MPLHFESHFSPSEIFIFPAIGVAMNQRHPLAPSKGDSVGVPTEAGE